MIRAKLTGNQDMLTKPPALIEGPGGLVDSSKFARNAIHQVFENIGGVEKLTEEALKDPKWFFSKMFVKTVQPEKVEVQRDKTVAELLAELDAKMQNVTPGVIDVQVSREQADTSQDED